MGNRPYNAGRKITRVTDAMGVKGIGKMQGTTRIIYDAIVLQSSTTQQTIKFFEDVNTRKFPYTNISENKLQVAETIAMQRFSFAILEIDITNPAAPLIVSINPLASIGQFKPLYRSDLSMSIAQDQVIKKLPLQSMYSAFNRNSQFNGSQTFGTNPGATTSFEVSHDVFHFDNPIVIPPQIEFVADLQIPAFTLPAAPNREWRIMMTLEGLGSLFAPKSTY